MAQASRGEGQCCLAEIFREEKCLETAFEGRESSRVPNVLGEIVPDVGTEMLESAKAMKSQVSVSLVIIIILLCLICLSVRR